MFDAQPYAFDPGARVATERRYAPPAAYLPDPWETSVEAGTHTVGHGPDAIHSRPGIGAYEPVPGALAPFDLQYGSSALRPRLGDLGQLDLSSYLPTTWWQWLLPIAVGVAGGGLVWWLTAEE